MFTDHTTKAKTIAQNVSICINNNIDEFKEAFKHEICLIFSSESVNTELIQKIQKQISHKLSISRKKNRHFNYSIINGSVDPILAEAKQKIIISRCKLGLLIPVQITEQICKIIEPNQFIEIINNKKSTN